MHIQKTHTERTRLRVECIPDPCKSIEGGATSPTTDRARFICFIKWLQEVGGRQLKLAPSLISITHSICPFYRKNAIEDFIYKTEPGSTHFSVREESLIRMFQGNFCFILNLVFSHAYRQRDNFKKFWVDKIDSLWSLKNGQTENKRSTIVKLIQQLLNDNIPSLWLSKGDNDYWDMPINWSDCFSLRIYASRVRIWPVRDFVHWWMIVCAYLVSWFMQIY